MQSGTADVMARELPRHFSNGMGHGAGDQTFTMAIPALEHLAWAVREQRVSDGYRRLLRAIRDESWGSNED